MASLEELQAFIGKDAVAHLIQDDGSTKETIINIQAATEAGVAYKPKGKGGIELTYADRVYEIAPAPVKPKSVTQRKLPLVDEGKMRQHLADRHGISLKWCKEATEEQAVEFHNSLDHADLGHTHVDKSAKKKDGEGEREEALAAAEA